MTSSLADAQGHLPLKPVVFHILLALVEGDSHGYGVIQAVRQRSGGTIQLETGPFYRHLKKLLDQEMVEETRERPEDDDARRGAYYRLTPFGRRVLAAESRRLKELVDATDSLGLLAEGPTS